MDCDPLTEAFIQKRGLKSPEGVANSPFLGEHPMTCKAVVLPTGKSMSPISVESLPVYFAADVVSSPCSSVSPEAAKQHRQILIQKLWDNHLLYPAP
jgi:hypothetical protein